MIECLDRLGEVRTPLIVDEGSGRLASAIREAGGEPTVWLRCLSPSVQNEPQPWPPDAPCDGAFIRLPKAKDALDLALHAAAARLSPGAPIAVFGANAEGIRSAVRHLEGVADDVATISTRYHARVVMGLRKSVIEGHKRHLADWRRERKVDIGGVGRTWVSYPGTFAKGGIDDGTAFLLGHLGPVPKRARVLDFAAGTGVIAAAIATLSPEAAIDMIEADALAVAAAHENVPGIRAILGNSLGASGGARYDLIVSNPPVHDGIAESRAVLDRLIAEAPRHLAPSGRLLVVVQKRIPVLSGMVTAFGSARLVAEDGRFTVAMAELATRAR